MLLWKFMVHGKRVTVFEAMPGMTRSTKTTAKGQYSVYLCVQHQMGSDYLSNMVN